MSKFVVKSEYSESEKWDKFVLSCDEGTFFHTKLFLDVVDSIPRYYPITLFVLDKNAEIAAMMIGYRHEVKGGLLSGISSRIVIPQLPLYKDEKALRALLDSYKIIHGKRAIYTEVRAQKEDRVFQSVAHSTGFVFNSHYNILVDCKDTDDVLKTMSESKRRQIRKALKSGVTVEENPSLEQVNDFYDILYDLYKTKVKKPLIDRDYFLALYKQNEDVQFRVKFLLVVFEGKIIGGIVAPISGNKVIHEHYVAGLDYDYKNQYPSAMATWAAIDYACRNGISYFDFMGAGKPDEDYGVRDFKLKFGGNLIESGRYEYVPNKFLYRVASKGFEIYSKFKYK